MEKFNELISDARPVLVDFYATWCGPCKRMHSVLEDLKREKGDKIRVAKVDIEQHQQLASAYQVQSVPTLMIFKKGELKWRASGAMPLHELKAKIEEFE